MNTKQKAHDGMALTADILERASGMEFIAQEAGLLGALAIVLSAHPRNATADDAIAHLRRIANGDGAADLVRGLFDVAKESTVAVIVATLGAEDRDTPRH